MQSLACVELMGNGVGVRGCEALGAALATAPPALLTLDLPFNRAIRDGGVALLCDGLRDNPVLKVGCPRAPGRARCSNPRACARPQP